MKSTGIVRRIDALGRLVLPKELRANFNIKDGDSLEIFTSNDMIVLKKYAPTDIFTGDTENLVEYRGKKVSINTIMELARIAGIEITNSEDLIKNRFEVEKI